MEKEKDFYKKSRRGFLKDGVKAFAAFTILPTFTILPSWKINGIKIAPSDRVVMGFIGLGRQAVNDLRGFAGIPGVEVAAVSDVE